MWLIAERCCRSVKEGVAWCWLLWMVWLLELEFGEVEDYAVLEEGTRREDAG